MRCLFLTTLSNDTDSLVNAWNSFNDEPAARLRFAYNGIRNDHQMLEAADAHKPAVIFYIGACAGLGEPSIHTFRALRGKARLINLICDAADWPWHNTILKFRQSECFDLHVALDGNPTAPADLVTVTPVDPLHFGGLAFPRDIRCGFSGTAFGGLRGNILGPLYEAKAVTFRGRDFVAGYGDHVDFMRRCRMLINTSWTGTGKHHQIKGRVIEAGHAGCCLLEYADSPIGSWFTPDSYLIYRTVDEAKAIIAEVPEDDIAARAALFQRQVLARFTARHVYCEMLERVGLHVVLPKPREAA